MVNRKIGDGRETAMIAYQELQKIVDTTVVWEEKMFDLYEVAELGLKNEDAIKAVRFLKDNHVEHTNVLRNINVENYGPTEWVKFTKDYREEDIIPKRDINRNSSAEELCSYMLEYEGKMMEFYGFVRDHLVTEKQIELFDSLVTFKRNQIERIKNCKNKHL